jgi:probable HAF family extracellular repeat protein
MRAVSLVFLIAGVAGCATDAPVTPPRLALAPQGSQPSYRIDRLPTLFGNSQGGGINNPGSIAGYSGRSDGKRHAALWRSGVVTDLGTLGTGTGLHSNVQWPGINDNGMVVGISQTDALDTLGEAWSCAAFIAANGHVCLGFAWQSGAMVALPTLGGENGFAAGVNNRGQVVGWAETAVHDPTCHTPQVLQFRAVLWEPKRGTQRQLPPLPGDSTSSATAINQQGQVVGISGECDVAVGRKSATHAVMWDGSSLIDLGGLGGDYWRTPMAINNAGVVVGFTNPPDGDFDGDSLRAFVWTRSGGMRDLGRFAGDQFSEALGVNDSGQIVGVSCTDVCKAVLWQDGNMYRLQDLISGGTADHLWSARGINAAGQITGRLIDHVTGKFVTYVATPVTP